LDKTCNLQGYNDVYKLSKAYLIFTKIAVGLGNGRNKIEK